MDERAPKPPLADDPSFLARLSDLDRGVIDPAPNVKAVPRPVPTPRPGAPRQGLTPSASAALAAASAALAALDARAERGTAATAASGFPPATRAAASTATAIAQAARDSAGRPSVTARAPRAMSPDEVVDRAARDLVQVPEAGTSTSLSATSSTNWRRRLLMAVLMLALMLAGAVGAGWTFRGPLQRVLTRWHVVPAAPQPPVRR